MSEFGAFTTIAGSINQAIGIGRILRDADKAFDQAEFKIKMSDMIDRLVDAKDHLQTNREENINLKAEIVQLKKRLSETVELEFDGSKYWIKGEAGQKDGPYCQKCRDTDGKMIRLQQDSVPSRGSYWTCLSCKGNYDYPRRSETHGQRNFRVLGGFGI